ncbi:MAG: TolC family protein [Phycisphaerae bacterium]
MLVKQILSPGSAEPHVAPFVRAAGAASRQRSRGGGARRVSLRFALARCLALLALLAGEQCAAPLDSIDAMLERHQRALRKLPEQERSRLMPYGRTVSTTEADDLLPDAFLTLEAARAIAIRANPDIHAAQARLERATWRIAEARARYFPKLVFSHNTTRTFYTPASRNRLNTLLQPALPAPTDIETGNAVLTTLLNALRRPLFGPDQPSGLRSSFGEHSTAFTASWTLFDGFAREAQLLAAKHLQEASLSALVDVERLLVQAVDAAYYQTQLAKEQLRIARADRVFSQEQLEETEKLRAAGRATKVDVDNFRVRVLAAQADVAVAEGAWETGRTVLAELMGLSLGTLPNDLELAALEEETPQELASVDPTVWLDRAMRNRPDVRQLEALLRSQDENVRAAHAPFLPSVAISGSWGFDRSSNLRYTVDDQSAAVVLEFQWELFSGGGRPARVLQAESARAETAAELNRTRLRVHSEVRQAVIDVRNTQQQIGLRDEALRTARENRRIVQAGYVAGRDTLTRLNEAQRDYITADADLVLARIRLRQAWSDLHAAAATYREATDPAREPVDSGQGSEGALPAR